MIDQVGKELNQSGSCDCGAVALIARSRIVSMFLCACINCQRATGSGHSAVVLLHRQAITVEGALRPYSRPAASGALFTRNFCAQCGSTVFAETSRAPGLAIVPVGIFAGENDWFKPNQLLFSKSHQDWDAVADNLPQHETYRLETRP